MRILFVDHFELLSKALAGAFYENLGVNVDPIFATTLAEGIRELGNGTSIDLVVLEMSFGYNSRSSRAGLDKFLKKLPPEVLAGLIPKLVIYTADRHIPVDELEELGIPSKRILSKGPGDSLIRQVEGILAQRSSG